MDIETIFLFITFCGLVGILLRRNLLNIISSLTQIALGIATLLSYKITAISKYKLDIYFIVLFIVALVIFCYAIALIMIRRRSTLQINELTELRG
jgi:drug/metabolite transporter (DMT)-like permease